MKTEKEKLMTKKWREKNREHIRKYEKEYRRKYFKEKPWMRTLRSISIRVNNYKGNHYKKNHPDLKSFLTAKDLKYLWFRDKAFLMKKPSIDRIDNNGDYVFKNCEYIEHSVNSGKDNRGEKHHRHKLTWKQAREIRKKYIPNKITMCILAKEYNICQSAVSVIVNNKRWKERSHENKI